MSDPTTETPKPLLDPWGGGPILSHEGIPYEEYGTEDLELRLARYCGRYATSWRLHSEGTDPVSCDHHRQDVFDIVHLIDARKVEHDHRQEQWDKWVDGHQHFRDFDIPDSADSKTAGKIADAQVAAAFKRITGEALPKSARGYWSRRARRKVETPDKPKEPEWVEVW